MEILAGTVMPRQPASNSSSHATLLFRMSIDPRAQRGSA